MDGKGEWMGKGKGEWTWEENGSGQETWVNKKREWAGEAKGRVTGGRKWLQVPGRGKATHRNGPDQRFIVSYWFSTPYTPGMRPPNTFTGHIHYRAHPPNRSHAVIVVCSLQGLISQRADRNRHLNGRQRDRS